MKSVYCASNMSTSQSTASTAVLVGA